MIVTSVTFVDAPTGQWISVSSEREKRHQSLRPIIPSSSDEVSISRPHWKQGLTLFMSILSTYRVSRSFTDEFIVCLWSELQGTDEEMVDDDELRNLSRIMTQRAISKSIVASELPFYHTHTHVADGTPGRL